METVLHTFHTLALKGFEVATCNGDLSVLVVSGEPSEEALKDCWMGIYSDWTETVADDKTRAKVADGIRTYELAGRIVGITQLVEAMRTCYSSRIKEELISSGFDLDFDPECPEQYKADLNEVLMWIKADELELEMLEAAGEDDSEEVQDDEDPQPKKKVDSSAITPKFFDDIVMEIYTQLLKAPIDDLEEIKTKMKTAVCARYIVLLKKHYATPTTK